MRAADDILVEICAWRCASVEELRAKGKYLLEERIDLIEGDFLEALLQSLAES